MAGFPPGGCRLRILVGLNSVTMVVISRPARERSVVGAPDRSRSPDLTHREKDVVCLLANGVTSTGDLSLRLGISDNTVKFHLRHILGKLRLRNRAAIVAYAIRHGYGSPTDSLG